MNPDPDVVFTKRIVGMSNYTYEERLDKLKLPSLGFRRLRGDMIEVFKITHNIYDPLTTKNFFIYNTHTKTRTNGYKMSKIHTNKSSYQHFFTNRIVNHWNGLPADVVSAETVNSFKNVLDKHFQNMTYETRVKY